MRSFEDIMRTIGSAAWARWKIIGDVYGDFQAHLFAVLFYFTIFAPFAVGVRLLSDPLQLRGGDGALQAIARLSPKKRKKKRGMGSAWQAKAPVGRSVDEARRQF
jgi:hypothetical protein